MFLPRNPGFFDLSYSHARAPPPGFEYYNCHHAYERRASYVYTEADILCKRVNGLFVTQNML